MNVPKKQENEVITMTSEKETNIIETKPECKGNACEE